MTNLPPPISGEFNALLSSTLEPMTQILLLVILPGMIGGTFNAWLAEGGFVFPSVTSIEGGRRRWDPGFLGNIGIGAIAGLVTFCLMYDSSISDRKLFGVCLLAGVAGGNVISSWAQRYNLTETRKNSRFFKDQLKTVLKQPRKRPPGTTSAPSGEQSLQKNDPVHKPTNHPHNAKQ